MLTAFCIQKYWIYGTNLKVLNLLNKFQICFLSFNNFSIANLFIWSFKHFKIFISCFSVKCFAQFVNILRELTLDKISNLPVWMACDSLTFHCSATSLARGSSGLGALSKAWIDRRTVLICRAGLHLSETKTTHINNWMRIPILSKWLTY